MRPEGSHGDYIALSLPSDPRYLGLLRTVVGRAADLLGFEEDEKQGMMLAVNEGCANIIEHCYRRDESRKIDMTLRMMTDRMEIQLRDYGEYQDIQIDPASCAEGPEPGGHGLMIMKGVMDEVRFRPAEDEGTLLTMVKHRSPGER